MQLKKITGPECPRCGCQDASEVRQVVRWGQPSQRRQCRHCGYTWTVSVAARAQTAEDPGPDLSPKDAGPDRSGTIAYHVVHCPTCGGGKCPVTCTHRPVRYHKCRDCGATFKSIEATD